MKTIYNNILRLLLVALMAMPLLATAQTSDNPLGTSTNPMQINNIEDFNTFAYVVNNNMTSAYGGKYYKGRQTWAVLNSDLTIPDNTMIGNSTNYYQGTFNGNHHTITINYDVTSDYAALFSYVGHSSYSGASTRNVKIENLIVKGNITTTKQWAGGVVGLADYAQIIIENVTSYVKMTCNGIGESSYCGGIVGLIFDDSTYHGNYVSHAQKGTVKIKCCAFAGSFEGGSDNGGLIGESRSDGHNNNVKLVEIHSSFSYCKPLKDCHYGTFFGKYIERNINNYSLVTNKVYNSYYLQPDDIEDLGDIQLQCHGRSVSQFKDGTVCRLLNEQDKTKKYWRQSFHGMVDTLPVTDQTHDEISWPILEGHEYSQLFSEINISGSFNNNCVKGKDDNNTSFYYFTEYNLPAAAAEEGRKYLPICFNNNEDGENHIIKNYYGVNTPFKLGWNGTQSNFNGNESLLINSIDSPSGSKEIVLTGNGNKFRELYVCAAGGGKNANTPTLLKVDIKYKDKSTQSTITFLEDWIVEAPNGYTATRWNTNTYANGTVFCYSLNDALDTEKEIYSITFTNISYQNINLKAKIFAVTGLKLSEPKNPAEVTANINSDGTKMTLTWTKVTELVIEGITPPENSISYVYDVANDKDFKNIVPGMENLPVEGGDPVDGIYTKDITGDFREKYVRVRAVNIVGQSLSTEAMVMPVVLYDDKSESETYEIAIPAMQEKIQEWYDYCAPESESPKVLDVKVMRTFFKNGYYNTICLPFAVTNLEESPLAGCELKKLSNVKVTPSDKIEIVLENATEIEAGVPYFIKWDSDDDLVNPVFTGVTITATEGSLVTKGSTKFYGTLWPVQLPLQNQNYLFLHNKNTFAWPNEQNTYLRGTRAYFQITDSKVRYGMPTSIVDNPDADIEIEEPEVQKLYQNGRIVIIKDGVKYDLFGRILE